MKMKITMMTMAVIVAEEDMKTMRIMKMKAEEATGEDTKMTKTIAGT